MNTLFILFLASLLWLVIGLILFAFIFNSIPETKRQNIIFACFVGPIGIVIWIIDWIISKFKQYYYE